MKKIELFIFDMDGLLIESGRFSYNAYVKAAKEFDLEINKKVYYAITGLTESGIRKRLKEIYGDKADMDSWRDRVNCIKAENFKESGFINIKNGVEDILKYAKEKGIKTALASSNESFRIKKFLKAVNLYDKFDVIISGNDISEGKPNPEIFIKACEKLNIDNKKAIVFEDSYVGVMAAKNAEIEVIQIPDKFDDIEDYSGNIKIKKNLDNYFYEDCKAEYVFENLMDVVKYLRMNVL